MFRSPHVTSHVSHITCHMSRVMRHMSHVIFFMDKVAEIVGEGRMVSQSRSDALDHAYRLANHVVG